MTPFDNTENLWNYAVTIKSGGNLADAIPTEGRALVGIQMPAGWDAAQIGYDVSFDNVTYQTAYDNAGNLEQTKAAASRFLTIPLTDAIFAPFVRIKSVDATNVAVNQNADRVLQLVYKRYLGGS